jgi:hypothetical protein
MQALVLIAIAVYYTAVATVLAWWLRKNSLWFTSFLAVVLSQAVLFGGDYLYRGYWESWNSIALVTSSAMCIAVTTVVALVFRSRRARSANALT